MQAWALSCSKPVTISEPRGIYLAPKATLGEKGEALVIWYTVTPRETIFLQAATRNIEKRWFKAESLGDFEEKINFPNLHVTREGNAFVGWECRKDEEVFYKFSKKTKGSWCPAITVASSDDFKRIAAADFDREGNPIVLGFQTKQETSQIGVVHYHHAADKKNYKQLSTHPEIFPFQIVRNPQGQVAALWGAPRKN